MLDALVQESWWEEGDVDPAELVTPLLDESVLEMLRSILPGEEFQDVVRVAVDSYARYAAEIAAAGPSWDKARSAAHTLKGSAGTLGCRRISEMAYAIEHNAAAYTGYGHLLPLLRSAIHDTGATLLARGILLPRN